MCIKYVSKRCLLVVRFLHKKKKEKFKHLHSTPTYFDSCNSLSFKLIEKGDPKLDLKIKEAL